MEQVIREERKLVYRGSIVNVYADRMRLPNGKCEDWDFIEHRMGAAAIVPVLADGRILLVEQYRPAIDRMALEVPAGGRDSLTEPTIVCASRELQEETGYICDELELLLQLKTTVAFCNEAIDVYLARNLKPGEQHLDEAEAIALKAFTLEELTDKILAGEIQDGKTVSAILAYGAFLAREKKQ